MSLIFHTHIFEFPYTHLKFPGQAKDENILFVTRESEVVLWIRLAVIGIVGVATFLGGVGLALSLGQQFKYGSLIAAASTLFAFLIVLIGWWWTHALWKKSIFVLTNRRLTKFIYTTPWNRYHLSLPLEKIVDTGAYAKSYFESIFGIGTFTARSSAGNRKDKYFYIENVWRHEDIANYINKVLHVFSKDPDKLINFRPFIPHLKGSRRQEFMKKFPDYWS